MTQDKITERTVTMSFDIIVGAQSGNEGKSKFSRFYSTRWKHYDAAIKIGGYCSNTFYDERLERIITSRMIPAATNEENDMLYIFPRNSFVNIEMVKKEAKEREISLSNIIIDNYATVCDIGEYLYYRGYSFPAFNIRQEHLDGMEITDTYALYSQMGGVDIIVEGQGGYRLGRQLHDARPCDILMSAVPTMTASGIASLLNIGPSDINDVILVSRIEDVTIPVPTYKSTISDKIWLDILKGEYCDELLEPADVFDRDKEYIDAVSQAIYANSPDILVLNFLDLVDSKEGKNTEGFTSAQMDKIDWIEEELGVTIDFIGNGETRMSHLDNPDDEIDEYEKDSIKVILPSSRVPSRELYENKPFESRYRCHCGTMVGKLKEGFICGNCKQPVVYHDPSKEDKDETENGSRI